MIEQDFVSLVQNASAVRAIAVKGGGFYAQLPEDFPLPSWTYQTVSRPTELTLAAPSSLEHWHVQVNAIGQSAADAINLANAIDVVLNGYRGVPASGTTNIQGVFRLNMIDFFDDNARDYRRVLDYQVSFNPLTA
jgi:hypothetical protein